MKTSKRKASDEGIDGEVDDKDKKPKTSNNNKNSTTLLSDYFEDNELKEKITDSIRNNKSFKDKNSIIYNKPFTCCTLKNFISDETYLEELKKELMALNFNNKSNDLYKFKQSDDLKKSSKKHISQLRKLLYQDFRVWLETVTGFELTDEMDMSCAKYEHTDILLCHDDELEGRRVAFILYLVPETWTAEDGGSLDLFSIDEHGHPEQIVESLVPQWNSLSFFEVSPVSFHQVSEVLSQSKTRLSISGWFHGKPPDRPVPYQEPCPPTHPPIDMEDDRLAEWINPIYLDVGVVSHIRERFEEESEIELQDFLLDVKYEQVIKALRCEKVRWNRVGPANKRHYERATSEGLHEILQELSDILKSTSMFKLLRTFTGLDLADTPLTADSNDEEDKEKRASPSNPRCRGEIRRWCHGNYTLVHDTDPEKAEYALDAMLYCGCEGWDSEEWGGFTSYLANEEDEELLSVHPLANSLALVYRDMDTLKFIKHINHKSVNAAATSHAGQGFCDFHNVYYE